MAGILETILHGTTNYFVDRNNNASLAMANDRVLYSAMVTEYMEEKSKKGEMHRAFKMGTRELRFEIMCRDKERYWTNHERVTYSPTSARYAAVVAHALATNPFFCIGPAPMS